MFSNFEEQPQELGDNEPPHATQGVSVGRPRWAGSVGVLGAPVRKLRERLWSGGHASCLTSSCTSLLFSAWLGRPAPLEEPPCPVPTEPVSGVPGGGRLCRHGVLRLPGRRLFHAVRQESRFCAPCPQGSFPPFSGLPRCGERHVGGTERAVWCLLAPRNGHPWGFDSLAGLISPYRPLPLPAECLEDPPGGVAVPPQRS